MSRVFFAQLHVLSHIHKLFYFSLNWSQLSDTPWTCYSINQAVTYSHTKQIKQSYRWDASTTTWTWWRRLRCSCVVWLIDGNSTGINHHTISFSIIIVRSTVFNHQLNTMVTGNQTVDILIVTRRWTDPLFSYRWQYSVFAIYNKISPAKVFIVLPINSIFWNSRILRNDDILPRPQQRIHNHF